MIIILILLELIVLLVFSFKSSINDDIDYDDILDNLDDYEYPYNHINRKEV